MKWENNYDLSCKILKKKDIFTFPSKTKFITKEDKNYSEENKYIKLNEKEEIIFDKNLYKKNYFSKINFSFNFMRNTFIIIDMSENSILVDFKPNRIKYIFCKLKKFIHEYFSYNYVSTITIVINHDCISEILCSMCSDPEEIIKNINSKFFNSKDNFKFNNNLSVFNQIKPWTPGGHFSLYNSLETIKEFIFYRNADYFTNDILIFVNSLLSYDNGIKNEYFHSFKEKCKINIVSLEVPYEFLKDLAANSGGKFILINKEEKNLYDYNTNGDMDKFLLNFSHEYCKMVDIMIAKPIILKDEDFNNIDIKRFKYVCFCHKKFQKIIYCCSECGVPYCYIPFFCFKCNLLNIDNTFLQLLLRAKNDNDILIDNKNINKCFPYKFKFYYDQYYKNEMYLQKSRNIILKICSTHEKELIRITELNDAKNLDFLQYPLSFQFKMLYYFLKFAKSKDKVYTDVKKNIIQKNFEDYIFNNNILVIILRDYMRCCGCSKILEINSLEDFDNIFIFSTCLDIFCLDCYKYLIENNIGCLECTN